MNIIKTFIRFNKVWLNLGSFFMKILLRLNGAKIDNYTYVSMSSRLVAKKIVIGKDVRILSNVKIKANEIIIGDGVVISSNTYITGSHNIKIGYSSYLGKNSRINLSRDVVIGNNVGFGENSIIWTHGYFPPADEGYPVTYAPVVIRNKAWISTNIIIMPGVTIGENVIVGAGSVVTRDVADNMIIAGNPARVIKEVKEIRKKVEFKAVLENIVEGFRGGYYLKKIKNDSYIKYKYKEFNIFILDSQHFDVEQINITEKNIFLVKNISQEIFSFVSDYYWFNFDNKTRIRTSYSLVKNFHDHLRSFGIRFLIK